MRKKYLLNSLIPSPSEILSAIKIPQQLFPRQILNISSFQIPLNFHSNPSLNILNGIIDFIDNLPNIAIQQLPLTNKVSKSGNNDHKTSDYNSSIINHQILNESLSDQSKKSILSIQSQNLISSIHHSLFNYYTNSFVSNFTKQLNSVTNSIQQLHPFSFFNQKSVSCENKPINTNKLEWLNQVENVINQQCLVQEKSGLICLGRFTLPVPKPAVKNIEPKSDARLIISKVMDMQKASEFINALAISTTNQESQNTEQINKESQHSLVATAFTDNKSSIFNSSSNSSSISKGLLTIANHDKVSEIEKYRGLFSGLTIDRLIGTVNIHHSGSSLNDDTVKLELEQAIISTLTKILNKNVEDST